jgi:hypothetical protein
VSPTQRLSASIQPWIGRVLIQDPQRNVATLPYQAVDATQGWYEEPSRRKPKSIGADVSRSRRPRYLGGFACKTRRDYCVLWPEQRDTSQHRIRDTHCSREVSIRVGLQLFAGERATPLRGGCLVMFGVGLRSSAFFPGVCWLRNCEDPTRIQRIPGVIEETIIMNSCSQVLGNAP